MPKYQDFCHSNALLLHFRHKYNTFLPTREAALTFVTEAAKNHPEHPEIATCLYADYGHMESHEIGRKEFKALKKTYKAMRKQKKSS